MNKVITVNLNGNAFQLEEGGYELLRAYLDGAAVKLSGNPDREEIMSDIEQAIADKLRALLGAYKSVAVTKQVEAVVAEMGPVEPAASGEDPTERSGQAASGGSSGASAATGTGETRSGKRLYRLYEGAMISGVCNGLAAYFTIDPTVVRLLFVVLTVLTGGAWIVAYLLMVLVIPTAQSEAEKNAARGVNWTAQEFIRRAKAGYYEGTKSFADESARREWKRKFKREARAWRQSMGWEMRLGADNWRHNWQRYWTEHPGAAAGWAFAMPFLSVLHAALALGCVVTVVTLLSTGEIFGLAPPAEIPVWLALILLLIVYNLVALPLKMAQRIYWFSGPCGQPGSRVFVASWNSMVWLVFVGVLLWLAIGHLPEVKDALHAIPETFRAGVDAVRDWWRGN